VTRRGPMNGTPVPATGGAVRVWLSVVVVLHDSAPELVRLLDSIDRHLAVQPELIVVDTGSRDDGADLAAEWGAQVVALPAGTGFGAANDEGVAHARGTVTALLNPDVRLLDDGLLRLAQLAPDRDALLVPRLLDPDGAVQRSAHPAPGRPGALLPALVHPRLLPRSRRLAADPWRSDEPVEVGWAIAAALVARTALLRDLGPFATTAHLFFEDMDLCLRAAERGVPTELRPEVRMLHSGGHSTGPAFGGEPHDVIARRRRAVIGERLGPRALARDDAAQAVTFATRAVARAATGRGGGRPAAQLAALRKARRR
jgi:N-acetylglucosaminyl-diphospho-decaprenol L-rhamnosyltransferase